MLTRRCFPLNKALQQNKRMIYSFSYRHSLLPNQIFRRLILMNGALNVIFPLNIHCNVAGALSESSKHKTLVFPFISILAPLFPPQHTLFFPSFITFLRANQHISAWTNHFQRERNRFLPTESWWDCTLRLSSDTTFNLGKERQWFKTSETIQTTSSDTAILRLSARWCFT